MNVASRMGAFRPRGWMVRVAIGLLTLIAAFGLFGYWVLPGIIKSQAERSGSALLHRAVTIEHIGVRPYSLALTLDGVRLMEPDGRGVLASFDQLQVQLSVASLVRLAPVIKQVRLIHPFVHLVRTGEHQYSIDDILAALSQPAPPRQGPLAGQAPAPARFAVYNIQVEGGRFEFDDLPQHAHHTVSDFRLGIPFVSSLPAQEAVFVEPSLSALINGAPLAIRARARPFASSREAVVDLDLDHVELGAYLKYLPFVPGFKLPGGQLDLHVQASFEQAPDKPPVLALSGRATLDSLRIDSLDDQPVLNLARLALVLAKADPAAGRYDVERVGITGLDLNLVKGPDHRLNLISLMPPQRAGSTAPDPDGGTTAADATPLQVNVAEVAIQDAAVHFADRDRLRPLQASVERFDMTIGASELDLRGRRLRLGTIASKQASFKLQQTLASATSQPVPDTDAMAVARGAAEPGPQPFVVSIGQLSIQDWGARIETRGLRQPAVTTVSGFSLAAEGLSSAAGAPASFQVKAAVNRRGALALAGSISLAPVSADLKVDLTDVDLLALQPYVTEHVNLLVTQANLSSHGRLSVAQNVDGSFKGGFRGELALGNLATIDKLSGNDFLDWKSLRFVGIDLRLAPLALDIEQIALSDFFARVLVDPGGRINLQDIVRGQADQQRSLTEAAPAAAAPVAQAPPASRAIPAIRIGAVTLQGGNVRFTDNFIKPKYTANLVDLEGRISGLSSQADSAATVDMRGQVNNAPLLIAGAINPIKGDLFVDLKASVHGMELAPLSPYSGKFVGYGIERGKLSFDVGYKLEHRQLTAENRLVLDQLTFGDKVDSPSATQLPVQFAVALLKDRNGVIDVDLPIGGSLDDPQFSVGGVILKVIVNLVTKAVTSPFALLGSLFGGGEELSFVEFDPGHAEIAASGETRLHALASAMSERPALNLQIGARVDPAADRDALRHLQLERSVRSLKLQDLVAKGESATLAQVAVSPEEYPRLLERVYLARIPGAGSAHGSPDAQAALPPAEIEQRLLASMQVGDDDLMALGDRRAQAVKRWLQETGKVPEQRLFLVASKLAEGGGATDAAATQVAAGHKARVEFSLR